ncbi:uncharacterized protein KY384_006325 [Bacidia gigantensis]|uniref:uncharacterized protein n=1 Tax=Bacidia gigantensis TaxID=2732470 RepID=UPI001D037318|nr:uncharacterized protein KY384_006325 [Bacidia gigantensis]KAG8528638.1 hypothetical protein KY384_006325 [Bacidia gigantensis]
MTALSMKLPGLTEGKMNALGGRLKWPFTEKEIIKSLERLRKCAATFQFALTVEGCNVLKQTLDTATKGLQVQLDTSTKVAELAQSIGTMSGIAKEALKMSIQVKEILAFANEMEEISNDVRHLTDDVKVLSTRAQNRHRIEVLDWLSSNKYSERHREVCGKRVQGTGNWLLECGTFQAWIDQCQPALCCTGNPGVGKSVLTSLVIDHLKETFRSSQDVIAYYYFDHQRQDRKPQEALYGSLLRQVVSRQPAIPQAVQNLYETAQQDHTQALLSDLVSTFVATLSDLNRCVIVIDALDECPDRSQRQAILRTLFNIKSSALQIFVTCRPHLPEIDHHFAKATQIAIAANEGDIKVYCRLVLEKHEAGLDHIDEELKEQVVETIANQARGM